MFRSISTEFRSVSGDVSKTIILVDDDQRVLAGLERVISRAGFVAAGFSKLEAALEMVRALSAEPAAAIIDVYLERGRLGLELTEALRTRFGTSIPIAMITGYTAELSHPYWCPPMSDLAAEGGPHLDDERIPVYQKPVSTARLSTFLVRAAAIIRLRQAPPGNRERIVAYAIQHGLTPQEARLLTHLACGSTRSSLPDDRGLSKDTVKSQVRNMLAKCEVGSTDELMAALLWSDSRRNGEYRI